MNADASAGDGARTGTMTTIHRRTTPGPARGATILEFLIYIAIVSMILVTATLFSFEFVAGRAKAAAMSEVTRNGNLALSRMALEVRESAGINAGTSVFGSNPGTLSLASASPSADPTIFAVASGALTLQQGVGAPVPLTSSKVTVTEFLVEDVSVAGRTRAVRIRLTLTHANVSGLGVFDAVSTFETTARVHKADGFSN